MPQLQVGSMKLIEPSAPSGRVTNLIVGLDATENTDQVAKEIAPRLNRSPQHLVLKKRIALAAYYKQIRSLFSTIRL